MEINLLEHYPQSKRPTEQRLTVTQADRDLSCQFGKDYFDGDRRLGYGGYNYHPRFWTDTVARIRDYYELDDDTSILDVGCAKGFMLVDFQKLLPKARLAGVDISEYAIEHAHKDVGRLLQIGNATHLPYEDNSFDLVTAINTVHNLPREECKQALREIQRVSRKDAFVVIDAWRTDEGRKRLEDWVLTAKTYLHVNEWKALFDEVGYTGDYYWFLCEPNDDASSKSAA